MIVTDAGGCPSHGMWLTLKPAQSWLSPANGKLLRVLECSLQIDSYVAQVFKT